MRFFLHLLFVSQLFFQLKAQQSFVPDTLKATDRALGATDSLLQFMNGFASPFFYAPNQEFPHTWDLFKPGLSNLSVGNYTKKDLLFSALPHLGFAYGFGAQGSQRLRLDYEQQFYRNTLFNLRYDRFQQSGFIRASELRYSSLDLKFLYDHRRTKILASFDNLSNDRQWSGGLLNWEQLQSGNAALLPVQKVESFTFQNAYRGQIETSFAILQDSIKGVYLVSKHMYQSTIRRYEETDSLELYYPQLFLSTDSCRDLFSTQMLTNDVGIAYQSKLLKARTALQYKSLKWQDTQLFYDTTEINLDNSLELEQKGWRFTHKSQLNLVGAAQGLTTANRMDIALPKGKIYISHFYQNAWPELIERSYQSNLTSYQQLQPEREQLSLSQFKYSLTQSNLHLILNLQYMRAKQIYRFDLPSMNWSLEGPQQALEAALKLEYKRQAWRWILFNQYTNWKREDQFVLPPMQSSLGLQWEGGVFKEKQLKMHLGAKFYALYGASTRRIQYLPFIESINWQIYETAAINPVVAIYNAQLDIALEVKTFRFFVQASNLLSAVDYTASMFSGIPYPAMQLRLGLTWDFWN
jgi:hypothetical protein